MATHTWIDGEAITASKLNAIERKKAFAAKELKFTELTYNEAKQLIEDTGCPYYAYGYNNTDHYYIYDPAKQTLFTAETSTSILTKSDYEQK